MHWQSVTRTGLSSLAFTKAAHGDETSSRGKPTLNSKHDIELALSWNNRRQKGQRKMANNPGRQTALAKYRQEGWEEAREAYLLEHTPGLKEHDAAQHRAFLQIEDDALSRHPDPTPDDIAVAEAAEAALPFRKRTEIQLRRSFDPLAVHLPKDARRKRKSFVQRGQRAWNRANPSPLTSELERALTAAFMKTFAL